MPIALKSITLPRHQPSFTPHKTPFPPFLQASSSSVYLIKGKSQFPNISASQLQNQLHPSPIPSHPSKTIKSSTISKIYQKKQQICLNQLFSTLTLAYVHIAFIPPGSIINQCLQGPNPWKVAIILEELGLKYETKFLGFPDGVKSKEFTAKNPNGR